MSQFQVRQNPSEKVEAHQWQPDNTPAADAMLCWLQTGNSLIPTSVSWGPASEALTVSWGGLVVPVHRGEWLVRSAAGTLSTHSGKGFEEIFEPATETPVSAPLILWTDVETVDLTPTAPVLEIGFRLTDIDLNPVAEDASWAITYAASEIAELWARADPIVRAMHEQSGLWHLCTMVGAEPFVARQIRREERTRMLTWLRRNNVQGAYLGGSSVHADRNWLTNWLPGFETIVHHRHADVSAWRILLEAWRPEIVQSAPPAQKLHRVIPDLNDTIQLMQHFRQSLGLHGIVMTPGYFAAGGVV